MMFAALALFATLGFAESKALAVQIHLDRAGYSCSAIDGVWGRKAERALRGYVASRPKDLKGPPPATPQQAYDRFFADAPDPFCIVEVIYPSFTGLSGAGTGLPSSRVMLFT